MADKTDKTPAAARKQRLARQLRANLKRRKTQKRRRAVRSIGPGPGDM